METKPASSSINNAFYNDLGERWYKAWDDPVALLRVEGKLKDPWVTEQIRQAFPTRPVQVLDIGCGAGFLANALSAQGHSVTGLDLSQGSLKIAHHYDATKRTQFRIADAYHLPFRESTFDAVTAMDFLEHVERPEQVIAEAARVLKPGGRFFFHTFNRNWIAWLIVIKGLEWFVKNTPKHMHLLPLFIKPTELTHFCQKNHMNILEIKGIRPEIARRAFWKLLLTREVPKDFQFRFTPSLTIAYLGQAQKHLTP
jgi:2-polyprenyl-6-hydroxyphenyl methylase / 3-demethylubiquinone-9 3-methyltransferase